MNSRANATLHRLMEVEEPASFHPDTLPELPVVLRGLGREWAAMKVLSPDSMIREAGGREVPARTTDDEFAAFFGGETTKKQVQLGAYLEELLSNRTLPKSPYVGNIRIEVFRELTGIPFGAKDAPFPDWLADPEDEQWQIWLGLQGQRSTIHTDSIANFNLQVHGYKRFRLYAETCVPALNLIPLTPYLSSSKYDPDHPDVLGTPGYARAVAMELILAPGDVLYLPPKLPHQAISLTGSVSVNRWVGNLVDV